MKNKKINLKIKNGHATRNYPARAMEPPEGIAQEQLARTSKGMQLLAAEFHLLRVSSQEAAQALIV